MDFSDTKASDVFFDVHSGLPREGPVRQRRVHRGHVPDHLVAARARGRREGLPEHHHVLGVGDRGPERAPDLP